MSGFKQRGGRDDAEALRLGKERDVAGEDTGRGKREVDVRIGAIVAKDEGKGDRLALVLDRPREATGTEIGERGLDGGIRVSCGDEADGRVAGSVDPDESGAFATIPGVVGREG